MSYLPDSYKVRSGPGVSGVSGNAETSWNLMPFSRSISPQSTRRSQRLFKIFFLGVLCELCGELLCFLFDQTGSFLAGDWAET